MIWREELFVDAEVSEIFLEQCINGGDSRFSQVGLKIFEQLWLIAGSNNWASDDEKH